MDSSLHTSHPFALSEKIRLSFLLLLLPLAENILYHPGRTWETISSMSLSAVYAAAAVVCSVASCRSSIYRLEGGRIFVRSGLFFRRRYEGEVGDISAVFFRQSPGARLTGAVRAAFLRRNDIGKTILTPIYITSSAAQEIAEGLYGRLKTAKSCRKKDILLTSAFSSDFASGLLILAPVLYEAGKLYGGQPGRLAMEYLAVISPVISTAAVIFLTGWVVCFGDRLIRYWGLRYENRGDHICIRNGLVSKNVTFIEKKEIHRAEFSRGLMSVVSGLTSLYISPGKGRFRDRRVLLWAGRANEGEEPMVDLLSFSVREKHIIRQAPGAAVIYLLPPAAVFAVLFAVSRITPGIMPYGDCVQQLLCVGYIPAIWWGALRFYGCRKACVSISANCVVICHTRRLSVLKTYIPFYAIRKMTMTRGMFSTDTLRIYTTDGNKPDAVMRFLVPRR